MPKEGQEEQGMMGPETLFTYQEPNQASQVEATNAEAHSDAEVGYDVTSRPQIKVHHPDDSDEPSRSQPGNANTAAESQTSNGLNLSRRASFDLDHHLPSSQNPADGFLVPPTITYSLHLTFENSLVHDGIKNRKIPLNDLNSYREIEEIAEQTVKHERASSLASRELNFRHGKCTIIGDRDYKDSQALTSLDDWKDICTVLINLWTSDYHRTLHLEIYREYYALQTKVIGTVNFAITKRKEIHSLMQRATWDDKKYIPRTDLLRVTSKDVVRQIVVEDPLAFSNLKEREAFIHLVQQKASRLLVMCIYANLSMECLKKLLDNGLDDSKQNLQDSDCCHSDCEIEFHDLVNRQGAFMAAEFWDIGGHQTFDAHKIIPMSFHPKLPNAEDLMQEEKENDSEREDARDSRDTSAKKRAYCGSGAYSNVYRVKIDPNHHRLSKDRDAIFAVKCFKDRPQKRGSDFQQELDFLNELRQYPHPHIVTHLATWTQDERYCMLFPYAQCNLRQYMRRSTFNLSNARNSLWLLEQLLGLADALREIHNMATKESSSSAANLTAPRQGMQKSGWHHDLKPENILFYRDRGSAYGRLCIADFGSGKVHTYRSGSVNTASANGTLTYEPPEAQAEGRTSRPYDVFSLGCVFLELLIWAVCDYRSVKSFNSERVARRSPGSQVDLVEDDGFWQRTESGLFTIRKTVTDWIQELQLKEHRFQEVLGLIVDMLEPDKRTRITAVHLWNTLNTICTKKKVEIEKQPDGSLSGTNERFQVPACPARSPSDHRTLDPIYTSAYNGVRRTSNAAFSGRSYLDAQNFTASPLERSPTSARDQHRRNSTANDNTVSAAARARNMSISSTTGQAGSSIHSGPQSPDLLEESSRHPGGAL